jgi:alpha-L-fucosidase
MKTPVFACFLLIVSLAGAAQTNSTPSAPTPTVLPEPSRVNDPNHPASSVPGESKSARDARMGWWRDAKFGMFIHWGVFSVPAGWFHGKAVNFFSEWLMYKAKIPIAEYRGFAKEFNPCSFDAAEFVSAAKAAGMKYIVITAKHHDGFAMFDSKASDWTIVRATPYKRDPLMELAKECRKQGMKLGFYYSQAQDWNNGGSIGLASWKKPEAHQPWDPAQVHDMDDYVDGIAIPQIRELLTNYGDDTPAVLWWDTPRDITKDRAARIEAVVQNLRPGIIQNNRLGGGFSGDTETPEGFIPPRGYPARDWETCMTFNDSWGYKRGDDHWKSTETLIRNLCDIASKGGNYLLNVGPDSHGEIPAESVKRLGEVGAWMKVNGGAIYGSTATPFGAEAGSFSPTEKDKKGDPLFKPDWTWRATQKPGHLYLILFKWPTDGKFCVPAFAQAITGATILADPSAKLTVSQDKKGITVSGLPLKAPDKIASVIDLKY